MSLIALPPAGLSLIEASAGTGKTHAITTLVVRLVVEARYNVRDILVVTFTNAAAAELRHRIRQRLRAAHAAFSGQPSADAEIVAYAHGMDPSLRQDAVGRLWHALTGFDEAPIGTLHAFCQRTLRELAFESLQRSDAELLTDTSPLIEEIVADFWVTRLHQADRVLLDLLDDAKVNRQNLHRLIGDVLRQPHAEVRPGATALATIPEPQHSALEFQLEALDYARRELDLRKRAANVVSFDDLLERLAQALRAAAGGRALATRLRRQYPVALVDEFQDTDPTQYEILTQIYLAPEATADGVRLIFVGDPKQAIYSFRGADIFTYMNARRRVTEPAGQLLVNRRSDPKLVMAVNHLFDAQRVAHAFVFPEIEFHSVQAHDEAVDALGGSEAGKAPLRILFVPRDGRIPLRGATMEKGRGATYVTAAVTADIARLVHEATIEGRAVRASDIAVLCRTNRQSRQIQTALRLWRIPSVIQGDTSVYATDDAAELQSVLQALAEPTNGSAVRAALATSLIGLTAQDLQALADDELEWESWVGRLRTLNETWLAHRFMPAFRGLLHEAQVPARLLASPDGERRMTNLLHLAELLQRASGELRLGPLALVEWLGRMRAESDEGTIVPEALQIRLESDDAAVRLTTVHCSKGLEFNITYCPFVWDGGFRDKGTVVFHDPEHDNQAIVEIDNKRADTLKRQVRNEMFAEDMRLFYVALTRARHMCNLVWGAFGDFDTAPLGLLLHPPADLAGGTIVERLQAHLKKRDDAAIENDLANVCAASAGALRVETLPAILATPPGPTADGAGASRSELRLRQPVRNLAGAWRTSSFSALTSSYSPYSAQSDGQDRDESAEPEGETDTQRPELSFDAFPAGARTGRLLHTVLENLDFAAAPPGVVEELIGSSLQRYGFGSEWKQPLAIGLGHVLDTPLIDDVSTFTLRQVPLQGRRSEMEFVFPVAHDIEHPPTGALTRERLARCFETYATASYLNGYGDALRGIGFQPLSGYLRGFIDLVFEHDGQFYVVDYKSNRLGARPIAYRQERLAGEMIRSHYVLQYHLYCVAVHRFLSSRIANYDYDQHFGGALYLFLRGMSPTNPSGNGVFFDRPPRALIEHLSLLLADPRESA